MQLVSKQWYNIFNGACLLISLLLIFLYLSISLLPGAHSDTTTLGINTAAGIFAGIDAAYILGMFLVLAKKDSYATASMIGGVFFILSLTNLISRTHPTILFAYIAVWLLLVGYSGVFGLQAVISIGVISTVFVMMKVNFTLVDIPHPLMVLLGGTYIVGGLSYFFVWRPMYKHFQSRGNQRLNEFSKMIKNDEQQSQILIESIADGVIVVDNDGIITLINESAAGMVAWIVDEAIGIDVRLVVKLNDEAGKQIPDSEDPFTIALVNKTKVSRTVELTGRNGKKITTSLIVSPVVLSSKGNDLTVGVVAVIRDISAQVATDKQKTDFVSTASHEMRTPIAAIEGYLSLAMNDKVARIDSKARDYLDKAYISTRHLSELFQDLLTSSKAEDGRISNHPEVVEMGDFIEKLVDNLSIAAQNKKLLVDFQFKGNFENAAAPVNGKVIKPLYFVHVDPDRLREVITNLFDNAVKYSDKGKITLGIGGTPTDVQFTIRDTGAGIPAEDIPHLFQKFYRVDNSAVRTIGGTGLGLYICKKIVELYNGKIWVESELGMGSTFHIDLPRINAQQAETLKKKEEMESQLDMPAANLPL